MKILANTERTINNIFEKKDEKKKLELKKKAKKACLKNIKRYSFLGHVCMLSAGIMCSLLVWAMVQDNTILSLTFLASMIVSIITGGLFQMIVESNAESLVRDELC